ncbi:MAG TPA: FadR/GntR family transcriptional regulator [Candidatus Acidoferrum sp.]|nr:FadR/GntR family transcriptional regulator [Candidatus Acidoferrum sp.]
MKAQKAHTHPISIRKSRTDEAIERVQKLIVSGEWGPGDRVPPEAELAAQLGLSRSSLREAVRALAIMRVLEVRQGDGTYVSSLEADQLLESTRFATHLLRDHTVVELFEVRRLLEPAAAALAAVRMDEPTREALKRELDRMVAAQAVEDLVEADAAFHALIARAAGNSVLRSLLDSLSTRTMRARLWRGRADQQALDASRAEHRHIYDAVIARDPELARTMAATHVATGEHWLRSMEAGEAE